MRAHVARLSQVASRAGAERRAILFSRGKLPTPTLRKVFRLLYVRALKSAFADWAASMRAVARELIEADGRTLLLEHIRSVFANKQPSVEVVEALSEIKDRSWPELGSAAKPITQNKLAELMKDFGIHLSNVWAGSKPLKGYGRGQLDDVFTRNLSDPLVQTARALGQQEDEGVPADFRVLGDPRPSGSKSPAMPTVSSHPSALAVQTAPSWASEV